MLTLYHAPLSRSSRILWLLEELGAPYEVVYTDIPRMDGSGGVDARNPHPERKVPALVHDGALITESSAIVLYLTDLFPQAGVGPRIGDPLRGPYLTWLAWYAGVIEPVMHFQFAGLAENAMLKRTFRGVPEVHGRILDALAAGPWMLGDAFSGADVLVGSIGQWMRSLMPQGEPFDGYLARCNARPALIRAAAKDSPPK